MSSDVVIRVEGLGKRYVAAHRRKGESFSSRAMTHLKEFLPALRHHEHDHFWALKGISFEVKRGDILGILGANGSGKSTLLKILSGVTLPTTGRARLEGRVGSLLEVGTGFHPDMTGRENIYFSGALLGLRQREIRAKFDEIVEFSGIEEFIDMPVKRYSSGMYVRLAYSVASMLRSDILILDEVMSVGDAAFREKSEKNIEKAASDGRTVLFVSHNTKAVTSLCKTGLLLSGGRKIYEGTAVDAANEYLRNLYDIQIGEADGARSFWDLSAAKRLNSNSRRVLTWISTHDAQNRATSSFATGHPVVFRVGFCNATARFPYISILIHNSVGDRVCTLHSSHIGEEIQIFGNGFVECKVNDLRLGAGNYFIMVEYGSFPGIKGSLIPLDCVPNAAQIQVALNGYVKGIGHDAYRGAVHKSHWVVSAAP